MQWKLSVSNCWTDSFKWLTLKCFYSCVTVSVPYWGNRTRANSLFIKRGDWSSKFDFSCFWQEVWAHQKHPNVDVKLVVSAQINKHVHFNKAWAQLIKGLSGMASKRGWWGRNRRLVRARLRRINLRSGLCSLSSAESPIVSSTECSLIRWICWDSSSSLLSSRSRLVKTTAQIVSPCALSSLKASQSPLADFQVVRFLLSLHSVLCQSSCFLHIWKMWLCFCLWMLQTVITECTAPADKYWVNLIQDGYHRQRTLINTNSYKYF